MKALVVIKYNYVQNKKNWFEYIMKIQLLLVFSSFFGGRGEEDLVEFEINIF